MTRGKLIRTLFGLVLVLVLGVGGYMRSQVIINPSYGGGTMGTSYSVKITGKVKQRDLKKLVQKIDKELLEVNRQMSTWDPESEISRFNHSTSTEPVQVSAAFFGVVKRALEFSQSTDGAFDPTLQPLLNLWGFGSEADGDHVPSDAEISKVRNQTGWKKITVDDSFWIRKSTAELSLALGAIAKGYGVDAAAAILTESGYENWFVEIGGEVIVKGLNPDGVPWKIGIQYPTTNPMDTRLQGILHITDGAVATSGDYRNYIEEAGQVYSHILDPRSGHAVRSDLASVSVFAPSCMNADGIATALFVMGAEEGLLWVEHKPNIEALFLVRGGKGEINEKFSSGFRLATRYTGSFKP